MRKPAMDQNKEKGTNIANRTSDRLVRWGLISAGTFFVVLGLLAILIPLLPTTPFLLLAAACYARGSRRFYDWLLNNRLFGKYIKDYIAGRGIPFRTKVLSISLLWLTIGYSTLFVMPLFFGKIVLVFIAVTVTIHILKIKTVEKLCVD